MKPHPFWVLCLALVIPICHAQAPLPLDIKQAEQRFFEHNFLLLAKQYDLSIADAQVVQSRLYPNPEVTYDMIAYEDDNYKYFPTGRYGNAAVGLEQLILMGGKRKARIDIAKLDKQRAQADFTDLARNLQYELWQAFFSVHHQEQLIERYDKLLARLETLIDSYQTQVDKNNIALKDLVRLKSVYVKIANDKSEESQTLIEQRQKLNLLIGTSQHVVTVYPDGLAGAFASKTLAYETLLQEAEKRPDAQGLVIDSEKASRNIALQRRTAIPDITLRAGYNQQGDAFRHQANVGIGIPLPVFDRNKGNIASARIEKEQVQTLIGYKKIEIENEVQSAYANFLRSAEEFKRINRIVGQDFTQVFDGINANFTRGNVSMIEFADFIESYNDAQSEVQRVKQQLALAAAQVNFASGTQNFNP